jgi:hypothetical protein
MTLPVLSARQPTPTLVGIGVQRVVSLPWAPDLSPGDRLVVASTKRAPTHGRGFGEWIVERYVNDETDPVLYRRDDGGDDVPLPLGTLVASATVEAVVSIEAVTWFRRQWRDQLPFIDPSHSHAVILSDAALVVDRCPRCWGSTHGEHTQADLIHAVFTVSPFAPRLPLPRCPTCDGTGRYRYEPWQSSGGRRLGRWG